MSANQHLACKYNRNMGVLEVVLEIEMQVVQTSFVTLCLCFKECELASMFLVNSKRIS